MRTGPTTSGLFEKGPSSRGSRRTGLLCLALAISVGLYQGWFTDVYDHVTTAILSEDARTAIDVRCDIPAARAARECQRTLKKLFLAGSLDPDTTLRAYCESVKSGTRFGTSRPVPPKLCVDRFGGWTPG